MDDRQLRDLLLRLQALERGQVRYRQGVITDDDPLSVALGGSDIPYTGVKTVAGLAFGVGDIVSCITFGNDLLVLGPISAGPTAAFRARRSANVSLGTASPQYCQMDVEDFDVGGGYGAFGPSGRYGFKAPAAGVYRFSWGITTSPLSVYGEPELRKNGSAISYAGTREAHNVTGGQWMFGTDTVQCAAADFLEMVLNWDNGGGAVTLLANPAYTFFNGERI